MRSQKCPVLGSEGDILGVGGFLVYREPLSSHWLYVPWWATDISNKEQSSCVRRE